MATDSKLKLWPGLCCKFWIWIKRLKMCQSCSPVTIFQVCCVRLLTEGTVSRNCYRSMCGDQSVYVVGKEAAAFGVEQGRMVVLFREIRMASGHLPAQVCPGSIPTGCFSAWHPVPQGWPGFSGFSRTWGSFLHRVCPQPASTFQPKEVRIWW